MLVSAEQLVRQDGYVIHYAALKTTDLAPEIARQFGVARSGNQAFLVINAQRELPEGRTQPIPATATGTATNLIGHRQHLELRPVSEGDVHYVVATFQIVNQEYRRWNCRSRRRARRGRSRSGSSSSSTWTEKTGFGIRDSGFVNSSLPSGTHRAPYDCEDEFGIVKIPRTQ
ncbi:MAG TPA: DUF4426 domain-containing protein [Solimonas sp.]|nr:DUF4426 domain-containing protein [Solimonas sp.]